MSSKFNETLSKSEGTESVDEVQAIEEEENKIITTMDELNAFAVVKAILRKHVAANPQSVIGLLEQRTS